MSVLHRARDIQRLDVAETKEDFQKEARGLSFHRISG
jgi:hypothetical protein